MTYEAFIEEIDARSLAVIAADRARLRQATELFETYQRGMAALGLKPLEWIEIGGWVIDLDNWERLIFNGESDNELNRARYDALPQAAA